VKTTDQDVLTDIWQEYRQGLDYLNSVNFFSRVEDSFNFTYGDQWRGLQNGNERPPQLNMLHPILKNSTALVGQNLMSIYYSSMNYGPQHQELTKICEKLNEHAVSTWERLKMDSLQWNVLQDSFISGDSFVYFYDDNGKMKAELLDTNNIMFADEQNPNIQEQPYVLIVQRRYVSDIKKEAKENGISDADIEMILPDDDLDLQINGKTEVKNKKKTTSVMKMWKKDGIFYISRSTKSVVYQPETAIEGLTLYPIAKYSWKVNKGSARGMGDIWDKIPNQIAINKSLYRYEAAIKANAYPHKVFNTSALSAEDVKRLSYPDSNIGVSDFSGQGVEKLVAYLQPASISPHAKDLWQDLITLTRDLSGAGDNLENIDPEQASGVAIEAAREAKTLNVNMQVSAFKQFVEDIALIWYDLWVAYSPNGLSIITEQEVQGGDPVQKEIIISQEELKELKIDVRVDVTPSNAYSKIAQEAALKELLTSNVITFEEYVSSLDDDSSMPKDKLTAIVNKRKEAQNSKAAKTILALTDKAAELQAQNAARPSVQAKGV